MTQQCWTGSHWTWVFLVAVPSIILWVVGIPVVGFRVLARNKSAAAAASAERRN
jgi:hypothetical protein